MGFYHNVFFFLREIIEELFYLGMISSLKGSEIRNVPHFFSRILMPNEVFVFMFDRLHPERDWPPPFSVRENGSKGQTYETPQIRWCQKFRKISPRYYVFPAVSEFQTRILLFDHFWILQHAWISCSWFATCVFRSVISSSHLTNELNKHVFQVGVFNHQYPPSRYPLVMTVT